MTDEEKRNLYSSLTRTEPAMAESLTENRDTNDSASVTETSDSAPQYPSDFRTVMEYINKGQDIPGVENITIEPTNDEIHQSIITKPKKPWE